MALTFDLQKGQALPGPPKKGLRQVCHYPNSSATKARPAKSGDKT